MKQQDLVQLCPHTVTVTMTVYVAVHELGWREYMQRWLCQGFFLHSYYASLWKITWTLCDTVIPLSCLFPSSSQCSVLLCYFSQCVLLVLPSSIPVISSSPEHNCLVLPWLPSFLISHHLISLSFLVTAFSSILVCYVGVPCGHVPSPHLGFIPTHDFSDLCLCSLQCVMWQPLLLVTVLCDFVSGFISKPTILISSALCLI